MSSIALIPARGGSVRVPGKNTRLLNGVPLLAYTIRAAIDSGCFEKVLVSSDETETLDIAARYGADTIRRPDEYSTDTSPDIRWVKHALDLVNNVTSFDTFSILRPTSPFRMPSTIKRAFVEWEHANYSGVMHPEFRYIHEYSSLRAVSPVSEHPGKSWRIVGNELVPVLLQPVSQPYHDSQLSALPEVYAQNASLEIAWTSTVADTGTISGQRIIPFLTEGHEGFDINSEMDWMIAEQMITNGVELPSVSA